MVEPERQVMPDAQRDDVGLVADERDPDDAGAPATPTGPSRPISRTGPPPLKYTSFDDRPGSTHNLVVGLVPPGAHVLEIGCATGYMSEVLRARLGCTVVGVEIDPAAAAEAAGRADRVIVGDVETLDWEEHLAGERFDAIVFADVLEHLRDPSAVLERARALLAPGGVVVASVPNVAHVSVRLALLAGEFRYRETGLLDETHMRFFTRASLQDLFERSGFAIVRRLRTRRSLEESEVEVPRGVVDEAAQALAAADDEATTYQFVVSASPAEHATELAELRRVAEERQAALAEALGELSDVRARLLAAEAEVRERDDLIARLDAHIEAARAGDRQAGGTAGRGRRRARPGAARAAGAPARHPRASRRRGRAPPARPRPLNGALRPSRLHAPLRSRAVSASAEADRAVEPVDSALELTVVIPCLDEAATLARCIEKAQGAFAALDVAGEVVVADNGSTDGSQEIAARLGARVVPVSERGYGAAILGGVAAARAPLVVMGDADDTYDFGAIGPFVDELRGGCDLVVGNRFRGGIEPGAMPWLHRYVGTPALTLLSRWFFRSPVRGHQLRPAGLPP